MESEFIASDAVGKETATEDLAFGYRVLTTIDINHFVYCDGEATMLKLYDNIYDEKSRDIGLRHEDVTQVIVNAIITFVYIRSTNNSTEPCTKGLSKDLIEWYLVAWK